MPEKFSIKKLFDLSPIGYYKIIGFAFKIIIVLLVVGGIRYGWMKIFPPPPANTADITVEKGGTATVIQYAEKPKKWWMPEPFVELFGGMQDDNDWFGGMKAGVRFD